MLFLLGFREKTGEVAPVFNVRMKLTTDLDPGNEFHYPDYRYYDITVKKLFDSGISYDSMKQYKIKDQAV